MFSGSSISFGVPFTGTNSIGLSAWFFVSVVSIFLLIGNDSAKLITETSPLQIGAEYTVQGIESDLKAAYCFNVAGYDYPILLHF